MLLFSVFLSQVSLVRHPVQSFSGLCTETGRRTTPPGLIQHLPGTIDRYDTAMKHGARSLMRAALCLFSGDSDMARRQTTRTNGASMTGSLLASYAGGNQLLAVYQVITPSSGLL